MTNPRRALAIAAAFLLPLGAVGGILGVAFTAVHLLVFGRKRLRHDGHWTLVLLPMAILPIVTTASSASATPERVLYAVALAAPLLLGWHAARRMVADAGEQRIAAGFVAGASVLAVSILVDAAVGWRAIPSGLFPASLHNTAAAVLVLAFPLALEFGTRPRTLVYGITVAALLALAIVASLSWVGVLGFVAAGLVFAAGRWRMSGLMGSVAIVGVSAGIAWWFVTRFGGSNLSTLGEVLSSRMRIFVEGLALASDAPWLGWGVDLAGVGAAPRSIPLGVFHVDDLVLPHFHSIYVQTLAVAGVLGFAALALVFTVAIASATGAWRHSVRAALVGHFASQGFDYAWLIASVVVSVGLVVALGALATDARQAKDAGVGRVAT